MTFPLARKNMCQLAVRCPSVRLVEHSLLSLSMFTLVCLDLKRVAELPNTWTETERTRVHSAEETPFDIEVDDDRISFPGDFGGSLCVVAGSLGISGRLAAFLCEEQ